MIFKSIKRRLGFAIVMAVAAVATAVVTGNSLVAAIVAIVVVVVLGSLMARGDDQSPDSNRQRKRSRGEPYSFVYRWKVNREPNVVDALQALDREGLNVTRQSPHKVAFRSGSQVWSRLFGGYFVSPKRLPIQAELRSSNATDEPGCTVELEVRDRFGIAVRDDALRDRVALAATEIRKAVEGQLEGMDGFEVDDAMDAMDSNRPA